MRNVKQLLHDMEYSKRDEFKNLDGKFTNAWTLRLLLEIIERMDSSRQTDAETNLETILETGGLDGLISTIKESLGESSGSNSKGVE